MLVRTKEWLHMQHHVMQAEGTCLTLADIFDPLFHGDAAGTKVTASSWCMFCVLRKHKQHTCAL